jgi:hypothetical protein
LWLTDTTPERIEQPRWCKPRPRLPRLPRRAGGFGRTGLRGHLRVYGRAGGRRAKGCHRKRRQWFATLGLKFYLCKSRAFLDGRDRDGPRSLYMPSTNRPIRGRQDRPAPRRSVGVPGNSRGPDVSRESKHILVKSVCILFGYRTLEVFLDWGRHGFRVELR